MRYDADDSTNKSDDITDIDSDLINDPKAQRANEARKKIDDFLERKRLKDMLDDSEDWDI